MVGGGVCMYIYMLCMYVLYVGMLYFSFTPLIWPSRDTSRVHCSQSIKDFSQPLRGNSCLGGWDTRTHLHSHKRFINDPLSSERLSFPVPLLFDLQGTRVESIVVKAFRTLVSRSEGIAVWAGGTWRHTYIAIKGSLTAHYLRSGYLFPSPFYLTFKGHE